MKNKRRLTVLCLVYLIAALVASCQPPVPPTPTVVPPPATPEPTEINVADFAFNEIIIIGPEQNVGEVISEYNSINPNQPLGDPIQTIPLDYLAGKGPGEAGGYPELPTPNKVSVVPLFSGSQYESLIMQLYENPGDISTLLDQVQQLNAIGEQQVFADPNYITDSLASNSGSCGLPYSGGGSPYSGGGSPFADLGLDIPEAAFMDQWAFQDSTVMPGGISLLNFPNTGEEVSNDINDGPNIGVFDTASWQGDRIETLTLPNGSFDIAISDSITRYSRSAQTSALATVSNSVIDHGWFATGLIKAIVPHSNVYLYRVLDDNGCGDLFTISAAIHEFLDQMSINLNEGELLNKVVLNLSLGVHVPDEIYYRIDSGHKAPQPIASLQTAIFEAFRLGAVIVAASGNDSAPPTNNSSLGAQEMQLPAYYENVLGVAASTRDAGRSCFSNKGDVAAPGGDGGPIEQQPCAPRTSDWSSLPAPCPTNAALCPNGVIGPSTVSATQYGFWSGTSFASPLVSGLAALAFDQTGGNQRQIYCLILEGTSPVFLPGTEIPDESMGRGIISVTKSLLDTAVLNSCGINP